MNGNYDDIIHLPHHVSKTRKRMSMHDRAAQFSPFAALTGYDAAIAETGRLTDSFTELVSDETSALDEKIRQLAEKLDDRPEVTITHFVPDSRKSGGAYVDTCGIARKIDSHEQTILMEDGTVIAFHRIYAITGEIFGHEF
ncbi:MAG: hypothetical protein IKJ99_01620 [Oscillospiraceae bacterium]|nr:hypothetical protein [Oscillospiraceae bacterium]